MNIEQTKEQYEILYGNRDGWSKTTKAVYDVQFNHVKRPVAAREHGVKTPTIHAFIERNNTKHIEAQKAFDKYTR